MRQNFNILLNLGGQQHKMYFVVIIILKTIHVITNSNFTYQCVKKTGTKVLSWGYNTVLDVLQQVWLWSGRFPTIAGHFATLLDKYACDLEAFQLSRDILQHFCRTFCNRWSRNLDSGHFATCGHVSLTYIIYTVNHMKTGVRWLNYAIWEQICKNMPFMTKYAVYSGKMKIMRFIAENSK